MRGFAFKNTITTIFAFILILSIICIPVNAVGSVAEIRFDKADMVSSSYFLGSHNISVSFSSAENALQLSTTGEEDPYVFFDVSQVAYISANVYKYVLVKYRAPISNSVNCGETQFFWEVGGQSISEERSTRFMAEESDAYQYQLINMQGVSYWTGDLNKIRLDPFASGATPEDTLYISSIVFCAGENDVNKIIYGTSEEESKKCITAGGIEYTASNYISVSNDSVFRFVSDFSVETNPMDFSTPFNRMKFIYSSSEPLEMTVIYMENGRILTDVLYLDAGVQKEFSALIPSYLDGGTAVGISRIHISTCTGNETFFCLHDIVTEEIGLYSSDVYYVENSRFKTGIDLKNGGGIGYIRDKTCSVSGLTNLINNHDTGRLIQQSYYGTGPSSQYTPGTYNNATWRYNPVQGGDQYGNTGRLIDIKASDNSVYIKIQPLDWSLNKQFTRSYMENTYTLYDDYIKVENAFTDYSGFDNPVVDQELPAFYVVSYLDEFTYYGGVSPWTEDALTTKSNLNFWGDPQYAPECRFLFSGNNTETWCSWNSSKTGFGIGIYSPNVSALFAGRYKFESKWLSWLPQILMNSGSDSTNYVAPIKQFKLPAYESMHYSYIITTGSKEEIRSTFTEHKDFYISTVIFDPNGGTNAPSAQSKIYGADLILSDAIPERDGYTFLGWATVPDAVVVEYEPGDCYTSNTDLTLYAVWQQNDPVVIYIVGDVNDDGAVDGKDKTIMNRYFAGWEGYDEMILSWEAADINKDGTVNAKDRTILNRYLAGWEGYDEYFA